MRGRGLTRGRILRVMRAAVATVVAAAVVLFATTAEAQREQIPCGSTAPVDTTAPIHHAVRVGDAIWFAVYPFTRGYPTKAIVIAQRPLTAPIVLRGWNCATGQTLRFWYRETLPLLRLPAPPLKLRRTGTLSASFGPWPAQAMRGGYVMFWRSGLWKVTASENGRNTGAVFVRS